MGPFWNDWSDGKKWAMGIVGSLLFVTITALSSYLWSLGKLPITDPNSQELIAILELRAESISKKFDEIYLNIEGQNRNYQTTHCAFSGLPNTSPNERTECDRIAKESYDLSHEFKNMKKEFLGLHASHIVALKKEQSVLVHEINAKIQKLLTTEFTKLATQNIGINPGKYFHGFETVAIDVRHATTVREGNPYGLYKPSIK